MTALRILVAEDNAIIAMSLSDVLEVLGHNVCAVTDTEAATVVAALFHRPDLMIVDDELHEGSGLAAAQEIEMTLPPPHIFSTGDRYRVLKAEPNALVLKKPFSISAIVSAIERAMRPNNCHRPICRCALKRAQHRGAAAKSADQLQPISLPTGHLAELDRGRGNLIKTRRQY